MPNAVKNYLRFAGGINTEASLINFPDGFSVDEENYTLLKDGSRRRRPGLQLEAGGQNHTLGYTLASGGAVRSFDWENVSGDPSLNFICVQVGAVLHFYRDVDIPSVNKADSQIDLTLYAISGATAEQIASNPVDCAYGRGNLFVTHRFVQPFWVKYSIVDDSFTVILINIEERDFEGVDDGYSNSAQPTSAISSHTYNLYNRGWTAAQISAFQTSQGSQPSKAMIPWLGLQRQTATGVFDGDGVRQFSPTKLVQELFQDASAPQGHFIRNPFNTVFSANSGALTDYAITTWTISGTGPGSQTVTVTTSGNHGLSNGNPVKIEGASSFYLSTFGGGGFPDFNYNYFSIDGEYTVSGVTATTFQITVTFVSDFALWANQYSTLGTATTANITNPGGAVYASRFKTVAFFAGRVWYAGAPSEKLSTKLFFSQVIESDAQYGKCYQIADPTDERISDLVPSDGGVITIPEAANVMKILAYESFLLVFASNGVWAIGPGDTGYFTATSYSVRKITDSGAAGPGAVILSDNIPMYWNLTDIYAITPDENSGFMVARNVSQNVINTLFNSISQASKSTAQAVFDDLNKKVYWLYSTDASVPYNYNKALIFDTRLGAFTKDGFAGDAATGFVASIFTTKQGLDSRKIKFVTITGNRTVLTIAELSNTTDYKDFNLTEPACYLVTNHEMFGDPASRKFGNYVYVFSNKTETGYVPVGLEFSPIRPSSTLLQARWDWADRGISGKWGQQQEVYRHRRLYVPADPSTDTYDNGEPMLVTKNLIRGTGKSLSLKFSAGPGKDSWIAGWQILADSVRT